jgi:AraC family transcriptional regulator, transcriptional activator of pobA
MEKNPALKKTRSRLSLKTYSFKPGFPHELEIASLGETLIQSREMVTKAHRADFYHIVWVQKGKPILLLDFKSIPMRPNSLLFIKKNRVLMYDHSGNYDGKVIRFTDSFFIRNEDDARYLRDCSLFSLLNENPIVSLTNNDSSFQSVLDLLEREIATPIDTHQHVTLQNLMHNFLILSERMANSFTPTTPIRAPEDWAKGLSQKFMDMIETGFRTEKTVSIYARRLGATNKRLQAATANTFGKSPKELIDERVALEAKRLILFSSATVKEISYELGFDEVTNFVKYFRKHAGTNPANFRTRYQA